MKLAWVLVLSTSCLLAQQQSVLTDSKLMGLAQAGVSEAELLRIVATAPKIGFDLQPVATDAMLKAGISERVIKAMAQERLAAYPFHQKKHLERLRRRLLRQGQ